uniref:Uncharacterized protein n=1 Tax=Arundo donax TaxID=35708 RepID=A0A0A9AGE2_ARUDO
MPARPREPSSTGMRTMRNGPLRQSRWSQPRTAQSTAAVWPSRGIGAPAAPAGRR